MFAPQGRYVDPPNLFASKVHWTPEPEAEAKEPEPTVAEPCLTNAKTMRAPIVPPKPKYQKRRLPGERLLRRVARIAPKHSEEERDEDDDLDDETLQNLHGALGDIVERMRLS